jgi:tetratricopeptide (TPR) repeat protein
LAKILLKKNQNYPTLIRENDRLENQLEREKKRYTDATPAEKARLKTQMDTVVNRNARIDRQMAKADVEINRAFGEYAKALTFDPNDKALLNEIANAYYTYGRYDLAAKTFSKLIALGRNEPKDYLQLGRWYLNGEKFKSADSVFSIVLKMDPNYLEAYVFTARAYSKMEADSKTGLAKPKFETVIEKASVDSLKNGGYLMEAFGYLADHYFQNDNFAKAKEYFNRMVALNPNNKDYKIRGYNGIGQAEYKAAGIEKTIEGRLPLLARAQEAYSKILSLDQNNESAKALLKSVQDFEKQVRAGINPNELKGSVKDPTGQPIANASIRVKDTAAETYTNAGGSFKFEIPGASETIVISASGFKSKEFPVQRPLKPLNAVLEK